MLLYLLLTRSIIISQIDSLLEIEAAVQLLKTEGTEKDENENPIDLNYKKLKTNLSVLDKGSTWCLCIKL